MNYDLAKTFGKWQERHPCPNCKSPRLDFTINNDNPIVCTNCKSHFGFKEVAMKRFGKANTEGTE